MIRQFLNFAIFLVFIFSFGNTWAQINVKEMVNKIEAPKKTRVNSPKENAPKERVNGLKTEIFGQDEEKAQRLLGTFRPQNQWEKGSKWEVTPTTENRKYNVVELFDRCMQELALTSSDIPERHELEKLVLREIQEELDAYYEKMSKGKI